MSADEITEEVFEHALLFCDWDDRSSTKHRATIRAYLAQQIAAARIEGVREAFPEARKQTGKWSHPWQWDDVEDYLKTRGEK